MIREGQSFRDQPSVPPRAIVEKESIILSKIIRFLLSQKPCRLIRLYNCPPFSKKQNKYVRRSTSLTPKGLPDLLFIRNNQSIFFEVKTVAAHKFINKHYKRLLLSNSKTHERLKNQILFREEMISLGIVCEFVSSVEDVERVINGRTNDDIQTDLRRVQHS